jgi:hypothetical protein
LFFDQCKFLKTGQGLLALIPLVNDLT